MKRFLKLSTALIATLAISFPGSKAYPIGNKDPDRQKALFLDAGGVNFEGCNIGLGLEKGIADKVVHKAFAGIKYIKDDLDFNAVPHTYKEHVFFAFAGCRHYLTSMKSRIVPYAEISAYTGFRHISNPSKEYAILNTDSFAYGLGGQIGIEYPLGNYFIYSQFGTAFDFDSEKTYSNLSIGVRYHF